MYFPNDSEQIFKSKIINGKRFALDLPYREGGPRKRWMSFLCKVLLIRLLRSHLPRWGRLIETKPPIAAEHIRNGDFVSLRQRGKVRLQATGRSTAGEQCSPLQEIGCFSRRSFVFLPLHFSLFTLHFSLFTFHFSLFTFHSSLPSGETLEGRFFLHMKKEAPLQGLFAACFGDQAFLSALTSRTFLPL